MHVLKLEWKVASTNQDGSTPIDMFGGESINYEGLVWGTTPSPLTYTIHEKHPNGSDFTTTRNDDNDLQMNFIPEVVPSSDADHHYSFPTHYSLTLGGHTLQSKPVGMEIYALWIKSFRDDATGKEWEVSIGDAISYEAIGPSSAKDWNSGHAGWMPDAWNPTGGNAKSGSNMLIPFTDEQRKQRLVWQYLWHSNGLLYQRPGKHHYARFHGHDTLAEGGGLLRPEQGR